MKDSPTILVTGADGQLGAHFCALAREKYKVCHGFARAQLDISDEASVSRAIASLRPDIIVNAAAFTDVDAAELDREAAYQVNRNGPAILARACADHSTHLIHISTDFVFDGQTGRPYRPFDNPHPINVYGQSKLAGEREILAILPSSSTIIRTSWLYAPGRQNFVTAMLKKLSTEPELGVAGDHIGTPTSVEGLAEAIIRTVERKITGILHWADCGIASRYDFVCAIYEFGRKRGLIADECLIFPVVSEELRVAAPRPAFTALDSSLARDVLDMPAIHWRERLNTVINLIAAHKAT